MDAILLTWRWQNFLTIAVMVVAISLLATVIGQVALKARIEKVPSNA